MAQPKPESPKKKPKDQKTILIVDDEFVVRSLMRKLLELEGYRILDADSIKTAQSLWEKNKNNIDLLLMDCVMPDSMNGQKVGETFRSQKPSLKVIYVSGYSLDELPGGDSGKVFLQKPFDANRLLDLVQSLLEDK